MPLTPFAMKVRRSDIARATRWSGSIFEGIYYSKLQKRYARGFTGSFVCRVEARRSGYRRSLLGLR